jgi:putative transposase
MTAANPELDVQRLCRLAGLPRSSYYRSIADHEDETRDHVVQEAIQAICLKHKYYGYRRVTAVLRRQDHVVNHKKVLRLMREDNLLALRRTPFLVPSQGKPETFMIVPNLIRGLAPSAPDQIWVADITYVHLARAFVYLAVILDAFSRRAVGWALRQSLDASVAIASIAYRQRLADHDVILSMSRPGNPFDNAKAESFMKTLKTEELNARSFKTIDDARSRIDDFIANIYNTERLHSALGYQSPLEFETAFAQSKTN